MAQNTDLSWPILGAQIFSTVLTAGGQLARGNAAKVAGQRVNAADQFTAAQLMVNAGQEVAAGQVAAKNQDLQTSYIVSQAIARAAASGGGAQDRNVIDNIARIEGAGEYRKEVAMYEGESRARQMRLQAEATKLHGENALSDAEFAKDQSKLSALSTVISGAAKTLFGKYGAWDN